MNIMQKKIYLMLLAALALPLSSMSQEKSYSWNDLVDWNGISFWYEYLIMSPGYFGPNALPVPELSSGLIDTASSLDLRTDYYFAKGDQTVDLWGRYQHSFLKGKVSVFADITALEYYSITDTMIRNERKLRSELPKGFVIGDLSFGTRVQILKNKKHWPDIVLESVFRTASGAHSGDGRYTDAPGQVIVRLRSQDENMLLIELEDTAPGVSVDDLTRIFEPLYRSDVARGRSTGGSGLGLAICEQIAKAHHGVIRAEASALGGVLFRLELPRFGDDVP